MMPDQTDIASSDTSGPTASRRHILLVEDDPEISQMLAEALTENGFRASRVSSATQMDAFLKREAVDLVVLDIMLPGEDGLSICHRLRITSAIPIIMLTARRADVDRIVGLEIGADDYVTKPFNSRELIARIRALLRRTQGSPRASRTRSRPLEFAGWHIDLTGRQLYDPEGVQVALTSVEFDLLAAFCQSPGEILSREQLIELTHGGTSSAIERSVDVHVSRIRQKIEPEPRDPRLIKTVRLAGYVFTPTVREI